jgi:hypothetical protein
MAKAFQEMLKQSGLTNKILAINADNASSNDTQTTELDKMVNSFNKENRVRCFNHTLQLSAKSLLKPFNPALSGKAADDDNDLTDHQGMPAIDEEDDWGDEPDLEDLEDDIDDENRNELQALSEDEQEQVLEETAVVRETVTKVYHHYIYLHMTNLSADSSTFIRHHPFNDHRSSRLASHLRRARSQRKAHPP